MTICAFAAVLTTSARAMRDYVFGAPAPVALARERVDFLTTARSRSAAATSVLPPVPRTVPSVAPASPEATAARDTSTRVVPSKGTAPSLAPPPRAPRYLRSAPIAPIYGRNPFVPVAPPTRAEAESILGGMKDSLNFLVVHRVMGTAERDSLMRVMATAHVIPGRAAQMPGYPPKGGLSNSGMIAVPLFSAGPSAAERRRDSAANFEYLARLRRLQDRVQARRESLRVADSMSRARQP
ncbi:MAG: hypothetical protein ABIY52_00795 [Gemmatimonadaceae bacterium]